MKLNLDDVSSLANVNTAKNTINGNSQKIEDAIENTLSRDGTAPNQMQAHFDMNGYRLLNVGDGIEDSDGISKRQMKYILEREVSITVCGPAPEEGPIEA